MRSLVRYYTSANFLLEETEDEDGGSSSWNEVIALNISKSSGPKVLVPGLTDRMEVTPASFAALASEMNNWNCKWFYWPTGWMN